MITINDFIKLDGFESVDGGHMIIVKKIMGIHIKEIKEKLDLKEVQINLVKNDIYSVTVKVSNGKTIEKSASDKILFTALDKAFKEIKAEL